MSGQDPAPLRDGLERLFKHLGGPPLDVITELADRWPEIVGPALAGPTRPLELVDGILAVSCDDAAWASQIGWMEAQIKERFSAVFPNVAIARVVARIAR